MFPDAGVRADRAPERPPNPRMLNCDAVFGRMSRENTNPLHAMKRLLLLLPFLAASCVTEDWYDYYDDGYYPTHGHYEGSGYGRPHRPPPPDDRYDRDRRGRDERPSRSNAGSGFARAGSFRAGSAVECGIPVSRPISKVRLVGTAGVVSVNSVVVREGSQKTQHKVVRRLNDGETIDIDLGGSRSATGLRISATGNGAYEVYVR